MDSKKPDSHVQPGAQPELTLIVAMDENGVIGVDGGMPWHIPDDLRWFKAQTLDKPILMGRNTFESIGRPLPRRRNMVLTRDPTFAAAGCDTVNSLDAAIEAGRASGAAELMVIGGAQVYALALSRASRLLVTRIEQSYAGDTHFPIVDWGDWENTWEQPVDSTDGQPAYRFMTWQRRSG